MKKNIWFEQEKLFIIRRAWRKGQVKNLDLQHAFDMHHKTAQKRIEEVLQEGWIYRDGLCFKPNEPVFWNHHLSPSLRKISPIPPWANMHDLIQYLEVSDDDLFFCLTGLKRKEFSFQINNWTHPLPKDIQLTWCILKALINKKPLQITYLSLKKNAKEKDSLQKIFPLSLQKFGSQMALYGWRFQKFDSQKNEWKADSVPRIYVLTRLKSALEIQVKKKDLKIYKNQLPYDLEINNTQMVTLNPLYNEEQIEVLTYELRIEDSKITLPKSQMFQFLRIYGEQKINPDAIWPPLIHTQDLRKK